MHRTKVLTTQRDPIEGVVVGVGRVLELSRVSPKSIDRVVHATTLATNVILERKGAATALVTTKGFRSLLALGRHGRVEEERYDLWGTTAQPIVPLGHTFEVDERVASDGTVLVPLDEVGVRRVATEVGGLAIAGVTICLLNSYVNDTHEQRVAAIFRHVLGGDATIVTSAAVLPEMREFERMTTTIMSTYVGPVMSTYLRELGAALAALGIDAPVHVMQSAGGVMPAALAARHPVHTVESGPAAGVIAAARIGRDCGLDDVISFDMGGTTAKAAVIRGGQPAISHDFIVGGKGSFGGRRAGSGVPIRIPAIDLAEVGSGGGSIAWIDAAGALRVGPRSAGASPGPACYALGGTAPTVSDADLVLGYLSSATFAGGTMRLDEGAAFDAIRRNVAEPLGVSVHDAAFAIHEIANADMAAAIHVVTVQRGIDPRGFALVATGGAAAMHACRIAATFDIVEVVVPPHAGVGSCVGLARTDLVTERSRTRVVDLMQAEPSEINAIFEVLAEAAAADLATTTSAVEIERSVAVRFVGQAHELEVAIGRAELDRSSIDAIAPAFRAAYRRAFGVDVDGAVQLVGYRARARVAVADRVALRPHVAPAHPGVAPTRDAWFPELGGMVNTAASSRPSLAVGTRLVGPHLVDDDDCTVVIPPGWVASVESTGALVLSAEPAATASPPERTVSLRAEILRSALVAAAEEASIVVVRAAYSAFVVEGSDASAAILDTAGRLVAQSMATTLLHAASLRCSLPAVIDVFPLECMRPGDVFCMNDVYQGGIHANDILVFVPVFVNDRPAWFTGTLIHILDLGGSAAAGVSSLATDVYQEGLQLPPLRIATAAGLDAQLLSILAANSRVPDATLGDLRALIAGAHVAARRVDELVASYGADGLARGVDEHLRRSEHLMRAELRSFPPGTYRGSYQLDDDGIHPDRTYTVRVSVTIDGDRAVLDFTGTDDQVAASINAGFSQTISGALFGLRCFLDPTIPMNEGCFEPVEFIVPRGCLLHATPPFPGGGRFLAVFAAVEAIFQALSVARPERAIAASGLLQPFALDGLDPHGRAWIHTAYELGGMGARVGLDGVDAVGVHHGGGRNAVPQCEPLESRFPFVVECVELIADSGGQGQWRGGMGTRTTFLLLTAARLTMRCDRLRNPPIGVRGGLPGRAGAYFRVTPAGVWSRLPDKSSGVEFHAGDRFVLETSGGGGLGDPRARDPRAIERDLAEARTTR